MKKTKRSATQIAQAMIDAHGRDQFAALFERRARLDAIKQQQLRFASRLVDLEHPASGDLDLAAIATVKTGIARLKKLSTAVKSKKYDPQRDMIEAALKNDGAPVSGLIFDRGRSTLSSHLEAVKRVVQLLTRYKRVPIVVDDNGEGSYDGWALSVCYDKRALRESANCFSEWQIMAGVVVWQRFVNDSSVFFQGCDPGWHWIAVDESRRVEMRGQTVPWAKATPKKR